MFENSRDGYEGFLENKVRQQGHVARKNAEIGGAAIGLLGGALVGRMKQTDELVARIAELEDALAVKTARVAGLEAMTKAYAEAHPNSPLRADSGKRYKDGDIKRKIHLIYETAFDSCLSKLLGISNPASRRVD